MMMTDSRPRKESASCAERERESCRVASSYCVRVYVLSCASILKAFLFRPEAHIMYVDVVILEHSS